MRNGCKINDDKYKVLDSRTKLANIMSPTPDYTPPIKYPKRPTPEKSKIIDDFLTSWGTGDDLLPLVIFPFFKVRTCTSLRRTLPGSFEPHLLSTPQGIKAKRPSRSQLANILTPLIIFVDCEYRREQFCDYDHCYIIIYYFKNTEGYFSWCRFAYFRRCERKYESK